MSLCSIVPPFYQLKLLKELMGECANGLAREGTVRQIVRPEPALGVCRQITRRMIEGLIDNRHMAVWWGLASSQRRARKTDLGALVLLLRLGFCLLTEYSPGLVPALLLGITP